eukprot:s108_g11.t1
MEDAFRRSALHQQTNAGAFQEARSIVLKGGSGITDFEGTNVLQNDNEFRRWSGHMTYLFRRSKLTHADGSLGLAEMICHWRTTNKRRALHNPYRCTVKERLEQYDPKYVRNYFRRNTASVASLLPLADAILSSNKNRLTVCYHTADKLVPGTTPSEGQPQTRAAQAAEFEQIKVGTSESDPAFDEPGEKGGKKRIAAKDMPKPPPPPKAPGAAKAAKTWRTKKEEDASEEEEGSKTAASSAAQPASASASASAGRTAKTRSTNHE